MSGDTATLIDPAALLYLERHGYVVVPRSSVSPEALAQALTVDPETRQRLARDPLRYAAGVVGAPVLLAAVAEATGVSVAHLTGVSRPQRLASRRHLGMYYAHETLGYSTPQIGRLFGGRDHTTVLHAVRRVQERLEAETTRDETVRSLAAIAAAHRARVLAAVERAAAARRPDDDHTGAGA